MVAVTLVMTMMVFNDFGDANNGGDDIGDGSDDVDDSF